MDFSDLAQSVLFQGNTADEIKNILECIRAEEKNYRKDEVILRMGDAAESLGMVISGSVLIENDDAWGNRSILDRIGKGHIFAETYACVPGEKLMVNVVAAESATILFLNMGRMLQICSDANGSQSRLLRNLLMVFAQKNLNLSRRIFHTSSKSIRGRLLSFLSYQAVQTGKREFDIAFNRQQLADYLGVDRSALSNELSKMQRDGLIRVERNHFRILHDIER